MGGVGMPTPYERYVPFPKLLSRNEPGDPLRCGFTTRVSVSNRQRPLAAREVFYVFIYWQRYGCAGAGDCGDF